MPGSTLLAWVDCETTGLTDADQLLEVACVITDAKLNVIDVGPTIALRPTTYPEEGSFVWQMHDRNGLLKACAHEGVSLAEAQGRLLDFLRYYGDEGTVPMAGSSVHFDRRMLSIWMPDLESWFHYRNVDVSSFKEMFVRWLPEILVTRPKGREVHRAVEDIEDSITELRYYMRFVQPLRVARGHSKGW